MLDNIKRKFYKDQYIKVYEIHKHKGVSLKWYHKDKIPNDLLINPHNVYYHRGYRTLFTNDNTSENIDMLSLTSDYPTIEGHKLTKKDFKNAIDSKVIKDLTESIKVDKFDSVKMLLLLTVVGVLACVYLLLKNGGMI